MQLTVMLQVAVMSVCYSVRSALTGSVEAARRAGIIPAANAETVNIAMATESTPASCPATL
jgi:hypothetical protein